MRVLPAVRVKGVSRREVFKGSHKPQTTADCDDRNSGPADAFHVRYVDFPSGGLSSAINELDTSTFKGGSGLSSNDGSGFV
jgi:hypothetical protein